MTRKIDKRACRKFAIPELEFNLNEGILHVERCPYIIRTAVHNISGQRILVLYIYQSENILAGSIKPRWVVFQGRDDFATLSLRENASATWQCSPFDYLNRVCRFDTKCAFYRQQDEARAAHFCKCAHSAISALICLQWLISRRKALERKRKKQRAIIERMKYVPVLPSDLKGFIHREVMPQYIFYDYQRKAPRHAYCTACRHEVSIAAAKHNTSGLCPRCKKKITFKCRGRRGRVFDRETVQVLQKAKNGELLLRIVKAYRTFTDADTPVYFSVYENARHFISLCSDGHCSTSPYYLAPAYKDDLTPWKCGYRPHFFSWRDSFEGDTAGHLYFRNLAELLRNTPWQYSQIERFARIAATMDAIPYLNAYVQWPVIEYLVKAKLFRLVSDIVYGSYHFMIGKTVNCEGKNLQDVLKLDRSWLPLLQEVDPGIAQLNVIQWFIYAGKRPDASMMKWCANNAIQDVSVLAELLSHMTMHKLMRYADAQYEIRIASTKTPEYIRYYSMANLLADYRDYLRMCKEMQYNVESSFILFPRNLKSAHDHVVEALDVKRTAEQEKAIADSFEEWQRLYQYKGKDLMVIPPHSSKELIDEGTALRHCVGRYVKRVAQRECVILFVRKVAEPDKSLCTVEVRDGQVVQTRGFDNEDPPAKIKAFIERWKRQVLCAADKTAA